MKTAICSLFLLSFLVLSTSLLFAQNDSISYKDIDLSSIKWDSKTYNVNRDSAYISPLMGIKKLMGGNKRFAEGKSIRPRQDSTLLRELDKGQSPFATIIGCSDSRVPNEMVFDQGLGDLFIIRTAGQVSSQASYGSIEFATIYLNTKLIVILGHTKCGAVSAAVALPENPPGHIITLINAIKPAVIKCANKEGDKVNNAVRQNVIEQVNALRSLEPVLSRRYDKGELLIVGAVYNMETGKVEFLEETFKNIPVKK